MALRGLLQVPVRAFLALPYSPAQGPCRLSLSTTLGDFASRGAVCWLPAGRALHSESKSVLPVSSAPSFIRQSASSSLCTSSHGHSSTVRVSLGVRGSIVPVRNSGTFASASPLSSSAPPPSQPPPPPSSSSTSSFSSGRLMSGFLSRIFGMEKFVAWKGAAITLASGSFLLFLYHLSFDSTIVGTFESLKAKLSSVVPMGGGGQSGGSEPHSNNLLVAPLSIETQEESSEDDKEKEPESSEKALVDEPFSLFFFTLLLPDMLILALAIAASFASAVANVRIPLLLGDLANLVSQTVRAGDSGAQFDISLFRAPAIKLIVVYAVQAGLTFCYITLLSMVGERLAERLRLKLFQALVKQDIAFFDQHRTGEILTRLTGDIQDFKSSFKMIVSTGLRSGTQFVGSVIALLTISTKLTTVLVIVVPSLVGFGAVFGAILRKLSKLSQAQVAKAAAVAEEALGNIRTVRAFAMEDEEVEKFAGEVDKARSMNEFLGAGIGLFQAASNFAINGIILAVLYVGGTFVANKEITAGNLTSFLVATQSIQRSLSQISLLFGSVVRGMSAGVRVHDYIKLRPSIPVKGGLKIDSIKGDISFENVLFRYPSRPEQVILDNLSLRVKAGTTLALCGQSGGGKSTIASMIERFYDPLSGRVALDGHDIRTLDPSWLRGELIGYINQEPVLFATTIKENIRYGRPSATDEEVTNAARLANADTFIQTFPNGYDTVVGERGVTVSGGQKQRIAIARAILKDPKILILDEATSALDSQSEKLVQEALDRLMKGRTVVIIAHRLSTIQQADLIAVIAGGRVVESGKHDELMARNGLYTDLVKRQLQKTPNSGGVSGGSE